MSLFSTHSKRVELMEPKDGLDMAKDAKNALARNVSRFKTLYPNGEAKLREDAPNHFEFLNSAEMVAAAKAQ